MIVVCLGVIIEICCYRIIAVGGFSTVTPEDCCNLRYKVTRLARKNGPESASFMSHFVQNVFHFVQKEHHGPRVLVAECFFSERKFDFFSFFAYIEILSCTMIRKTNAHIFCGLLQDWTNCIGLQNYGGFCFLACSYRAISVHIVPEWFL